MKNTNGFTIIELVIVCSVLLILGSSLSMIGFKYINTSRLKEAAAKVATDLEGARSKVQLNSQDITVTLCEAALSTSPCAVTSAAPSKTYSIYTGTTKVTRNIPNNITIEAAPMDSSNLSAGNYSSKVKYSAPYSEINAIGTSWILRSSVKDIKPMYIKVISVTGKVVVSGTW